MCSSGNGIKPSALKWVRAALVILSFRSELGRGIDRVWGAQRRGLLAVIGIGRTVASIRLNLWFERVPKR